MEGGRSKQELLLVEKISEIYESICNLSTLSPSKDVDRIFTELVHVCIPHVSIDISKLSQEVEVMRSKLISICGQAEGLMESHFSDLLASHGDDNPLDHLHLFPYYNNYLKLSHLEYTLLSRYLPTNLPAAKVAFIGSGPLPLSSIVLASRHMPATQFHNYDLDAAANARACRLVEGSSLAGRMVFHTANIMEVSDAIRGYDVVFLAALVGIDREEKARVMEHLARYMAPGAFLVVRSAHGARAFLYPVVEPSDLKWFDVMTVYHPTDEVINSVIVARKPQGGHGHGNNMSGSGSGDSAGAAGGGAVMRPCQCCGMVVVQGMNHQFGHGGKKMEEVPMEELQS